jgi:SAM-dependent methyltransferase
MLLMPRGVPATRSYFERHSHEYHPARLRRAVRWIDQLQPARVFEVGCGNGGVLEVLAQAGITELSACDVAETALARAGRRVDFAAHRGSILDRDFVDSLPGGYDVVVMAAVLHHLVGRTRRSSRGLADTALRHALSLLAPQGHLVIVEPTYAPRWAMTAVFWVKRVLGLAGRRLELGEWNNLGAPLVSYYDPAGVRGLVAAAGGSVERSHDRPQRLRRLPRALGIRGRWITTVLVNPPHI